MPSIKIDDQIFAELSRLATIFHITPNDVLRRMLYPPSTAPTGEGAPQESTSLATKLGFTSLIQPQSRQPSLMATPDKRTGIVHSASREHQRNGTPYFFFGFQQHQADFLGGFPESYVVLSCGSSHILKIPFQQFLPLTDRMNIRRRTDGSSYRYVHLTVKNGRYLLHLKGKQQIDLTENRLISK
jgi:hypothetical protein